MFQLPSVEAQDVKGRLGSILIETVEAIRAGSGPLADRIISEYAMRCWAGFWVNIIIIIALVATVCRRMAKFNGLSGEKRENASITNIILCVVMIIPILGAGINLIDAVSPVYSLLKELTRR